jgi:uncharacterized protein with PIN domain
MVETAAKEAIADKLESNTLRYYGEFWRCPNCSQVYWKGAHWKQIKKTLELSK